MTQVLDGTEMDHRMRYTKNRTASDVTTAHARAELQYGATTKPIGENGPQWHGGVCTNPSASPRNFTGAQTAGLSWAARTSSMLGGHLGASLDSPPWDSVVEGWLFRHHIPVPNHRFPEKVT